MVIFKYCGRYSPTMFDKMIGILIVYRLKAPHDATVASALVKKLYGQETSSHKCRYKYHRKGLLDKLPYRKLIRGVLIVRSEDKNRIVELLDSFNAEFHIRKIVLTPEDIKTLRLKQ